MATRVLVIEDNDDVREEMEDILGFEGFEVRGAATGRLGIDLIRSARPDVVLCDVMMPEMDGHSVLQTIRADPALADLPFVFVSARSDRDGLATGSSLGADGYVTKPFTAERLLSEIRRVLPARPRATAASQ